MQALGAGLPPGRSEVFRGMSGGCTVGPFRIQCIPVTCLKNMRLPGVEPGAQAWKACMLPLHYRRP